jgi:hypothetical protein
MTSCSRKYAVLSGVLFLLCVQWSYAGPPFNTDDPEPVDFKHWEYYISSINTFQSRTSTGTIPHFEVNYGLIPNVQVHLLLLMNYDYTRNEGTNFGYAYTEFGMKYRFVQESDNTPQIGVFPIIEIPTIKNNEFGNGKAQIYLPVWLQKSWDKLTTYGGVGYWINPGTNNKNWIFFGWELQYDISSHFTFGGEIYYHTANTVDSKSVTGFNLGGFINFTEKFHLIYSVGHSLTNDSFISSYAGLLWTI